LHEVEDVVLGHAAGDAGTLEPADVDVVLGGDLADERGGFGAAAFVEILGLLGLGLLGC